jgi:hypothetical protein
MTLVRWSSAFTLIKNLLAGRRVAEETLCAVLGNQKASEILPKEREWSVLEALKDVLEPFDELTTRMGGDSYVSVASVLPALHQIFASYTKVRLLEVCAGGHVFSLFFVLLLLFVVFSSFLFAIFSSHSLLLIFACFFAPGAVHRSASVIVHALQR